MRAGRLAAVIAIAVIAPAAMAANAQTAMPDKACAACIASQMQMLAGDAMRGRGSGTPDELAAATYIGAELQRYGIAAGGDVGTHVQTVQIINRAAATPPVISFSGAGKPTRWRHGEQLIVFDLPGATLSGPLQVLKDFSDPIQKGAVVLAPPNADRERMNALLRAGAAMLLVPAPTQVTQQWAALGKRLPPMASPGANITAMAVVNAKAVLELQALQQGTPITLTVERTAESTQHSWNAIGILPGSDPLLAQQVVLFSAHLDHLGVATPVDGDAIYNGADDDASGVVAVLELARVLGAGLRPKRTVVFALFGGEEKGGLGANWFLAHPPFPLANIVANLEFEMIGRPDPAVKAGELWLTGWDRSNLGPTLAQQGASLVGDPHPEQNFFERSDNIVLARKGVVAQTVSSFSVHPQYHRPSDDLTHIDWAHMEAAIGSMIAPARWLVNTDFRPEWAPGRQP
jgi:hypothetical protein